MKKNRMMRLASILLVCVLLSTSVISGTFAKYTSTASGTDTAKVAKWDIKLDGAAIAQTFGFDLFETIVDTVDGNADEEVAANVIAPGTKGSFDIVLKNDSEVDAQYKIDFTSDNKNVPLTYTVKVDGTTTGTGLANVAFARIDMGETKTVTVEWVWAFDGDDTVDTGLGLNPVEPTVTATVVVEQVN